MDVCGMRVTSDPESISIRTSPAVLPLLGSRNVTIAIGAGGLNNLESYVGIGCVFDYLLLEVLQLLRMD
jgi:hypothetical protein